MLTDFKNLEYPKITLRAARVNAALSQKEAAGRLGINPATLRSYEDGHTSPDWDIVQKMERLYSFPADFIFFGKYSLKASKIPTPH